MHFHELNNEQRRQLTDTRQLFDAYQQVSRDLSHRYAGSMRWLARNGREYLHRALEAITACYGVATPPARASLSWPQ